jgi:hypothetical protein
MTPSLINPQSELEERPHFETLVMDRRSYHVSTARGLELVHQIRGSTGGLAPLASAKIRHNSLL